MNYNNAQNQLPAPCIVDRGILINKEDMQRILDDLGYVRYSHLLDDELQSEGEGYVVEVFADPQQATLVANHAIYINVCSFDYLKLDLSDESEAYFDLVQDRRQLRLIPMTNLLKEQQLSGDLDAAALEAMVAHVLSTKCDVQLDDEEDCPF